MADKPYYYSLDECVKEWRSVPRDEQMKIIEHLRTTAATFGRPEFGTVANLLEATDPGPVYWDGQRIVREAFRRHDLYGLMKMGTPDDEYDSEADRLWDHLWEARLLAERLSDGEPFRMLPGVKELKDHIYGIFVHAFDKKGAETIDCEKMVLELQAELPRYIRLSR
jgi:hypothetical protein